jgi:hypothetical protein
MGGTDHKEWTRLLRRGVTGALVAEYGVYAVQGRENEADLPPGMREVLGCGDFI